VEDNVFPIIVHVSAAFYRPSKLHYLMGGQTQQLPALLTHPRPLPQQGWNDPLQVVEDFMCFELRHVIAHK